MYYRQNRTVAYYECDVNNRLKLSGALQYMQQVSSRQLATLDQSPERLYREGLVFLLVKTNLKIERMPLCSEEVSVGTAAVGTKGPRFVREFVIDSARGERLISAYSLWVLTDTINHRILRPGAYPYSIEMQEPQLEELVSDIPIPRENSPNGDGKSYNVEIRYSHLDINRHVNNCIYGDFLCDALPYDVVTSRQIQRLALAFHHEARQGDLLQIYSHAISPHSWKVVGNHSRGTCFDALVELSGR